MLHIECVVHYPEEQGMLLHQGEKQTQASGAPPVSQEPDTENEMNVS